MTLNFDSRTCFGNVSGDVNDRSMQIAYRIKRSNVEQQIHAGAATATKSTTARHRNLYLHFQRDSYPHWQWTPPPPL